MLLVYPPKFCITIVSNFSWVLQSPQEKSTTMVMQNFGGQTTCIMAYVRMVNSEHFCQSLGSSLFRGATVSWSLEQTMISRFALLRLPLLSDGYYSRGNLVICSTEMFISREKTVNSRGWKFEEKRIYRIPRGSKPQGRQDFSDTYSYFSSIIDYVVCYRWAISISDWQITIKCHLLLNTLA